MGALKWTLIVIGVAQLVLGIIFLVPGLFASILGLEDTPEWVNWMFAMFSARAIGFAYGMFLAARNPAANLSWIKAMIGVQAFDWLATVGYLLTGAVTIAQVTTAAFLPVVFIVILGRSVRSSGEAAATAAPRVSQPA